MPKRRRKDYYSLNREYSKKRRYRSCSPSRERATRKALIHSQTKEDDTDMASEIRILKIKLDLITAQVNLLRKQLHQARQAAHTGQKAQGGFCILMKYLKESLSFPDVSKSRCWRQFAEHKLM